MSGPESPALEAVGLAKEYPAPSGPLRILRDCTLTLPRGASAAIMGPSGCGKSTLLNVIGTLEPPTAGSVRIDSIDPYALPDRELARFRNRWIGFVFQDHHLLPQCTVLENVLLPTFADPAGDDRLPRARELLARVGLDDRLSHRPAELSGGERQRVAIARALINQPTLVLADEPTGNLDRATAECVADLLIEINREQGVALLVVTHSESLAARLRQTYELCDGTLAPRACSDGSAPQMPEAKT
ncbi:MAG: ABC transporter ATP-binding protein [Planctomycetota bacterium]|nr:MAG: ABC transporter ATP-binding protein [Planctomycetota bacterium]